MKNFEQWLIDTLSEPAPDWVNFDHNGNSPRAVVMRMRKSVFSALKYEFISLWKDIVYEIKSFDGFDTSIGWFMQVLLLPVLIFIAPFIRTYTRYKDAMRQYQQSYAEYVTKEMRKDNGKY